MDQLQKKDMGKVTVNTCGLKTDIFLNILGSDLKNC